MCPQPATKAAVPLAPGESANVAISPVMVGNQLRLNIVLTYLDPTFTEQSLTVQPTPQGLWNGLAPLIFQLQSGVVPSYLVNGQGPQRQFDLSRITGGIIPSQPWKQAPPPTVDWPYSRRTPDQHAIDAGELDEAGNPVTNPIPVRAPSYSGPYATSQTETENDINSDALAGYTPPPVPVPPVLTTIAPTTAAGGTANQAMTLTGTGFKSTDIVRIDGVTVPATVASATSISLTWNVPAGAGTNNFTVVDPLTGLSSAPRVFTRT